MRVNLRWLNELVRVDVPLQKLTESLSFSGLKVEAVHKGAGGLAGVVVAEVVDIAPHPNADTLTLVVVKTGEGDEHRIVCGVRNYTIGDRVPLATVGARLGDMEISERKIRGETSSGMLCSPQELNISREHTGIFILPPDAPLGQEIETLLDLDATVLELEVTPNRPDCMGMIGIAREVSALLGNELHLSGALRPTDPQLANPVKVDIEDPQGCLRFTARYMEDVKVGPSPLMVFKRLLTAGVRPISNVVDITNYVMLETGQPLHAFDATKIAEQHIIVRRARRGEAFETLDGTRRELHPDDLLIADPSRPLGMAGLMGGADSEVTDETTSVVLEAACFDAATIAYMSRRHFLRTEASARFERQTDPNGVGYASARAAQLMAEHAGARLSEQVADEYPKKIEPLRLTLRPERTNKILGREVRPDLQAAKLRSIQLEVIDDGPPLDVVVPTFRPDLKREIDLVEEVARLVGYDTIPSTVPPGRTGGLNSEQVAERKVKVTLAGFGIHEAWTPAFTSERELEALRLPKEHPARRVVRIENPMTADEEALRTTLLPGLLKSVARNIAHQAGTAALFEIARVFEPTDEILPQEAPVLAAVCTGARRPKSWNAEPEPWDFFTLKGVLESMLESLGVDGASFSPVQGPPFHPTRAASVRHHDLTLGALGEIHPDVCDRFDVPEGTVAMEIALPAVFSLLPDRVTVGELPKFPPIFIDLAIVVSEDVPAQVVEDAIWELGRPEVTSVRLFDLYRGEQVGEGNKSLAYALALRAPDRTMTDDDAAAVKDRIVQGLAARTGARLRS